MKNYAKQFKPLTFSDVEFIRHKQNYVKDICAMLEKEVSTEKETINLEVAIMPQLNTSVEGYYIMNESISDKDELPILMTKEVYDAHLNKE